LPEGLVGCSQFTFLGRGWTVGLANEAGLKMREASLAWAEAYPAMEYRHGPISVTTHGTATWMFGEAPKGLAGQVRETGGLWVDGGLDPLAELVRAQRLAVAVAAARGLDPDRPRHLTRSVILGR
jgi:fructoselysine-6-P-deglycase FrlB-like protein